MSETNPDSIFQQGQGQPELFNDPSSLDKFEIKFASHSNERLRGSLQEMMHTEIVIPVHDKVIHITPFDELQQSLKAGNAPDWDILVFSATQAGVLPRGDSKDQVKLHDKIFSRLQKAYESYHRGYHEENGQPSVDKIIDLHEMTEAFNDSALIVIIDWLREHMPRQPDLYFIDAERIVRILILEEILNT